MSIFHNIVRYISSDKSEYCCLCFDVLGSCEIAYNIEDEVTLEQRTSINEMISSLLGDKVLQSITTQNTICQKCAGSIINSYKFIKQCHKNIEQLYCIVECLQNCTKVINDGTNDFKSLFLALDTKYNANLYYDKNRHCNNSSMLLKRFTRIFEDAQTLRIDFELESDCQTNNNKNDIKRRKQHRILKSIQLADILCDENDLGNLKCKVCLQLYSTVPKLKRHYLRVHASKDFKCSQCPRSFGTLLLLQKHLKGSHSTFVCTQCGKTYTNIHSLQHHEQSHKLRLICPMCGKIYKGKQAFSNHIKMKSCEKTRKPAEANFICDYCGKKYSHKTGLSVHINLEHENGKALVCDWCGKKYSFISRLKAHIVKHTKQKDFKCEQCGGMFVTKASLLYHTRVHTGERPYKCEYCDMIFLSSSRRSEHAKRHHTETALECDICHNKYKGTTCLLRHRKKHFDVRSRLYCKP